MERLDLDKTIFVISGSALSVLMISLIAEGRPVHCVMERGLHAKEKKPYSYEEQMRMNFCDKCVNLASVEEVYVPQFPERTGHIWEDLKKIIQFRNIVHREFKPKKGYDYVGFPNSIIMRTLNVNKKHIYYLHHGTPDYYSFLKRKEGSFYKGISGYLHHMAKKTLFWSLGLSQSHWADFFSMQGFSLADLRDERVGYLDYHKFQSTFIENEMKNLSDKMQGSTVLYFVDFDFASNKIGVMVGDDIQIEELKRLLGKEDVVFIKWHPTFYVRAQKAQELELPQRISKEIGNNAYDLVSFIPESIGGPFLPAEIILRYCKVSKMMPVISSTLFHAEKDYSIKKIWDLSFSNNAFDMGMFNDIIECFKGVGIINDSYLIM